MYGIYSNDFSFSKKKLVKNEYYGDFFKHTLWYERSYFTANVKDSEIIKKSTQSLGQSTDNLKYFSLKIAQMIMFTLWKSEKTFQIKIFL